MGRLDRDAFLPSLTNAMGQECGDLLCDAARDALVAIGAPAQDHLIARWGTLDGSQRIYGLSAIEAIGGDAAAAFALVRYDDLCHDDPESWCRLATAAPDQRLLDLVEQLPRQQGLFDETFYQLAHLLDLDHPQLNGVGVRVRKRRAEQQARMASFERGDWFQDTLNLALRCPECGDIDELLPPSAFPPPLRCQLHGPGVEPGDERRGGGDSQSRCPDRRGR